MLYLLYPHGWLSDSPCYKVHAVICHHADLPVFVLVTPAHLHDSQVGWLVVLLAALLFGLKVLVVYADTAYFDRRMFRVVREVLSAYPAIHYNLRKAGKKKLATLFFSKQWQRLVITPRWNALNYIIIPP